MTDNLLGGDDNLPFDENKNWLEEYTKKGGKFHDPDPSKAYEKLAKAKAHSDHYIRTLEQARDADRETLTKLQGEYNAAQSLREIIDQMNAQQNPMSRENTLNPNDAGTPATFDPKQIDSLVSTRVQELFTQTEQQRREQANFDSVKSKAIERFGDSYHQALKAQATALDMSDSEVDTMARRNPKLFIRTFGLDEPVTRENFQAPPQSSQRRNTNFVPMARRENRTKSYYEELRRTDPKAYLNPKTLIQMEKDVQALGWEAFNDMG